MERSPGSAAEPAADGDPVAAALERELRGQRPGLVAVLGSGLSSALAGWEEWASVDFSRHLPWIGQGGVPGHARRWRTGILAGTPILVLDGRIHLYEGYTAHQVVAPLRAALELAPQLLLLTNAAGCLREDWEPGDLMLLADHVNLTGASPLCGGPDRLLVPDFIDLTEVYSRRWRERLQQWARSEGIALREGTYAGVAGPTYETPAEVRALGRLGIDAVGMSTVLEAILARACGCPVIGVSCLTNRAAGLTDARLDHDDVLRRAVAAAADVGRLLRWLAAELAAGPTHPAG